MIVKVTGIYENKASRPRKLLKAVKTGIFGHNQLLWDTTLSLVLAWPFC
jgi:hypothetical protein